MGAAPGAGALVEARLKAFGSRWRMAKMKTFAGDGERIAELMAKLVKKALEA